MMKFVAVETPDLVRPPGDGRPTPLGLATDNVHIRLVELFLLGRLDLTVEQQAARPPVSDERRRDPGTNDH
jgi:hypothetical protein